MSYIRCGSNPERLYVYTDGAKVDFTWVDFKGRAQRAQCSDSQWRGLVRAYKQNPHATSLKFGPLLVEEVRVSPKTGRVVKTDFSSIKSILRQVKSGTLAENKRRLTFESGQHLDMWYTTYRYMLQNAVNNHAFSARKAVASRQENKPKAEIISPELNSLIENTIIESREGKYSAHDANLRGSIKQIMQLIRKAALQEAARIAKHTCEGSCSQPCPSTKAILQSI